MTLEIYSVSGSVHGFFCLIKKKRQKVSFPGLCFLKGSGVSFVLACVIQTVPMTVAVGVRRCAGLILIPQPSASREGHVTITEHFGE